MLANTKTTVAIISDSEGIVVRGIIGKLKDNGIPVRFIGDKEDQLERNSMSDIFVVSLGSEKAEFERTLKSLCSLTKNTDQKVLLIGEKTDFFNMEAELPELKKFDHMGRPVDLDELVKYVLSYDKEEAQANAEKKKKADELPKPEILPQDEEVKKILIVDDDAAYAKMVRSWVKDVYATAVVTSGMQAITYMLKNKVDLVLLDYEMPVVSGAQVMSMMREEEALRDVPVIFLTGVSSLETVKNVMALKPEGYILKSSPCEELLDKLTEVLNR